MPYSWVRGARHHFSRKVEIAARPFKGLGGSSGKLDLGQVVGDGR